MWLTVYSFRCEAFLISQPFRPPPPLPPRSQPPGPASEPAGWPDAPWMEPAYWERGGEIDVIMGDYSDDSIFDNLKKLFFVIALKQVSHSVTCTCIPLTRFDSHLKLFIAVSTRAFNCACRSKRRGSTFSQWTSCVCLALACLFTQPSALWTLTRWSCLLNC